jgi:PAS domain S-box-containing protein
MRRHVVGWVTPPSRWRLPRLRVQAAAVLVGGVLVLAGFLVAITSSLLRAAAASDDMVRARQVALDNRGLLAAVITQDTALRGYVATGRQTSAQAFEAGRSREQRLLLALDRETRTTALQASEADVRARALDWSSWAEARRVAVGTGGGAVAGDPAEQDGEARFARLFTADDALATLAQRRSGQALSIAQASSAKAMRAVLIGGPLLLLADLALAAIVILATLRPLTQLATIAEDLVTGQDAVVVPHTKRADEIGALARALQHLQLQERLRSSFVEHAPIGVVNVSLSGHVLAANAEITRLFGFERRERLHVTEVSDPKSAAMSRRLYGEVASGEHERFTQEKEYQRKDGSKFWGEVTVAGVRDAEGVVRSFVGMIMDISDRKEKMARAAAIQRDLLPQVVPAMRGYQLAGRCTPAEEMGGDFFDWYVIDAGQLTLTLGDVMGKGMPAAILMATVRAALRAGSRLSDLTEAVSLAADSVTADLEASDTFVTLAHARLEEATGEMRVIDAGHGFVFVLRAGGELVHFPRHNLPLGVVATQGFEETRFQLEPADIFVAFSDGVLDLFPGLEVDLADLSEILRGSATAGEVVERLSNPSEGTRLADDVTVVALRRSPAEPVPD